MRRACIPVIPLLTDDCCQRSQIRFSVGAVPVAASGEPVAVVTSCLPFPLLCLFPSSISPPSPALLSRRYTYCCGLPLFAGAAGGQGSGAVVRVNFEAYLRSGQIYFQWRTIVLRWWCSGHRRSLRRQLLVSKTSSLVLGWRALVSEISTFDSSRFLTTNEKQIHLESILDLNELPGSGGYSLLVGSLWLGGVAVKLMRRVDLPSSSFSVTASVGSISAVRCFGSCHEVLAPFIVQRLVDVAGYQLLVSPNKSGCELDVEVLVVPVRGLQYHGAFEIQEGGAEVAVCVRWFRRFGAAPLSSAASSEFSLVSLLFVGGRALW
ncbi:LOW QUALITY PROTEIN: hypothetical protein HID58_050161 [Brassica napus]|uniref:Uncharacterized protein n=1 Tax=Brassica napus TaxID=3708 RepID=A0ABQ8A5B9_BRANA|nr:LOW QUALITY PROTEIN: hypothetical protein HID58_050161 [Brassica napus]